MLVHLIAQSHIDPVFMWNWDEGLFTTLNTCHEAVRKLHRHTGLRFVRGEALSHLWLRRFRPDLWKQIRQLARRGRWVPVGGWFVQGDANLPSGESLIRQALVGQQLFDDLLGVRSDVAYLVDSFGYPRTFPKILRHCGFPYFVVGRPDQRFWNPPSPLMRWRSDDGSSVLTYRIPVNYSTYTDEVERIGKAVELMAPHADTTMCFFGLGDHGGGPTEQQIRRVLKYARRPDAPDIRFSHPRAFFEQVEHEPGIPDHEGALEPYAVGCYSAAFGLKKEHDSAQQALLGAERFAAILKAMGAGDPEGLRPMLQGAWQDLLYVQFHDLLPGSAIKRGLAHAARLAAGARVRAEEARTLALTHLTRYVDTRGPGFVRFVVFNPTDTERTFHVEYEPWLFWQDWKRYRLLDERGRRVPHQLVQAEAVADTLVRLIARVRLPAGGCRVLRVVGPEPDLSRFTRDAGAREQMVSRRTTSLTTPRYHVRFDPKTGVLTRVEHAPSRTGLTFDRMLAAEAVRDRSDPWTLFQRGYAARGARFARPTITQIEEGPLRWTVMLHRRLGASTLEQEVRFFADSDAIEIHNRIAWHEPWRVLKLLIPSPFKATRIRRGVAFGSDDAPEAGTEACFQNWLLMEPVAAAARGRLKGLALVAGPGLHAADVTEDGSIRLTLVRSPVFCQEPLGGKHEPGVRHEHMDIGDHRSVFVLLPLFRPPSVRALVERSLALHAPPPIVTCDAHRGSCRPPTPFVSVKPANVALSALKPAEDGRGIIARCWETAGRASTCQLTVAGREVRFPIRAHAIRTVRLVRSGRGWSCRLVDGTER